MADQPTDAGQAQADPTDELVSAPTTHDGASGPLGAPPPGHDLEHRRIVSIARHKLFGRGPTLQVGRFRIERRIGAGGMGEVYLAHDDELGRRVAIKRVRGSIQSPRVQDRLRREARALARLSHPNVVQVYEVGEHEGRTFVAMEFVDGQTLGTALAKGSPSWRRVLDEFLAAGRGLAAVHEAGLVHRDFKPDNVLLSNDGRVLVADFGLVMAGEDRRAVAVTSSAPVAADPRSSVTGSVLGTIRYMPLEQLTGGEVDARSDQFSFCVSLYEALWDKPPFSLANTLARLHDLELGVPARPRAREGLRPPVGLWRVIRRGLAKDPSERWPDMPALLDAIERVVRRRRRTGWYAALGVAATALFVAGVLRDDRVASVEPCAAIERELEGTWDAPRRADIEQRLGALEVGHASDSRARVLEGLDRWSAGWVHERRQICQADVEQRIEPELARLQGACLTRQRERVEDLVSLLGAPETDGDTLAGAVEAVAELPRAASCADELALLGVEPPAPAIELEVEALRRELGRAANLRRLGRVDEALTLAEQTEADTRTLGYAPLLAEALAELAKAEITGGSLQRGTERLQEAIDAAELARHDHLAADLWVELTLRSLVELDQPELGSWQLRRAEVASGRVGVGPRVTARLSFAKGQLASLRGDDAQAEDELRAALSLAEADPSAEPDLPSYLSNLAILVSKRDYAEAEPLHRSAVTVAERLFGPHHPFTAPHLYSLAVTLRAGQPDSSEAVDLLERAVDIWQQTHQRPHPSLASAEFLLGTLALRRGAFDEAFVHAEASAAIRATTLPARHLEQGDSANLLAVIHGVRGDYEQAIIQLDRAIASWEPTLGIQDPQVQRLHADRVANLLALGRIDDANREIGALIPHVETPKELAAIRLQACEVELRSGRLGLAAAQLDLIDELAPEDVGDHEFSYVMLRALIALRRHDLAPEQIDGLAKARNTTSFTDEQIDNWLDQLEVSPDERATLLPTG